MVYCSALDCQNATSGVYKNSAVTFYGFPLHNEALLRQWLHNMGRDMGTPSKYQRLCSKHFEDSSFERDPFKMRKNRRLLKEAVPKKFLLGEDGTWRVGAPRGLCGGRSNRIRKRLRSPELLKVPEMFDNVAAHAGRNLEGWQEPGKDLEELYRRVRKEDYRSLTTLGEDCPVPKSSIRMRGALRVGDHWGVEERESAGSLSPGCGAAVNKSRMQSYVGSSENAELCGSSSGGSQESPCQISDLGVTSESPHNSGAGQGNPRRGGRRGGSSPGEGESDEFKEILFSQESQAGERLYVCAECKKTFKLKIGLVRHQQIHAKRNQVLSYICTGCGKSFGHHAALLRHQRTHTGERPYECTECGKSFTEKPRLTNHLRAHSMSR